jgi:hypothetical protein
MFKINRFVGLFAFMTLLTTTNAASLPSFVADEIATLDWGNGVKQVALDRAPANNFGPKRLLIDNTGTALYVLDASNQRIWTFNLTTEQFSAIHFSDSTAADDFCVLDHGEHFYLLFETQKKVVLYNQHAKVLTEYRIKDHITPIGIQCDERRGLIIQGFDGNAYQHHDDRPLQFQALVAGGYVYDTVQQTDSEGQLWLQSADMAIDITIAADNGEQLATFHLIGVDNDSNLYVSVETVINTESPPQRWLRKYSLTGQLLAETKLAYSLYAYTIQDLVVAPIGDVFQIIPHKNHLKWVRWRLTTELSKSRSADLASLSLFYTKTDADDFEQSEPQNTSIDQQKAASRGQQLVYRQQVIELADKYANQSFRVNSANITSGRYLGGKYVITPISSPGWYTGIPYKWCGDDTIATVLNGLRYRKKAGDRCTKCRGRNCGSTEAVGVDCSGLISELWQLGQKYSTRNLPSVSTRLSSKTLLQPGDILNKPGHVRLFSHRDASGRYCVYEASSKDWKVSKRCYYDYQLTEYRPYRYKWIADSPSRIKNPTRYYIYGNTRLTEGRSNRYRAKVFYDDGSYQEVTNQARWIENSRYVYFQGATLHAERVTRRRSVYIKSVYTENGQTLKAGVRVKMVNQW